MRSPAERYSEEAEQIVRDIRRAVRRQYSAEEKVRIVIAGSHGEESIGELCRKEGINQNLYYRWSKEFLEAGKKRLVGDTVRGATSKRSRGCGRKPSSLRSCWPRSRSRTGY
jgi:transposase